MGPTLLKITRNDAFRPQVSSGEGFGYTDTGGGRYVFVLNTDVLHAVDVTVTLPAAWSGAGSAVDVAGDESFTVRDGSLTVNVAPGDARLLRLGE